MTPNCRQGRWPGFCRLCGKPTISKTAFITGGASHTPCVLAARKKRKKKRR